jgi:hypothetical protein
MSSKQQEHLSIPQCTRGKKRLRVSILGLALTLAACTTPSTGPAAQTADAPPSVEVYFYPTKGQSLEQQERDRYECYLWARNQTGFDPSSPGLAPGQRVQVEPATPSGQKTATGAFVGALLGAATSRRGEKQEGAVKGAIAGAIIGATSEAADAERARQIQQQEQAKVDARLAKQADEYRRAMSACLEGRGYKVK